MSESFHGSVFQALVTRWGIEEDDGSGFPYLVVGIKLISEADDTNKLDVRKDVWNPVAGEPEREVVVPISEKTLGKKLLPTALKTLGFNGEPVDILIADDTTFNPVGRKAIVACNELPEDWKPTNDDGSANEFPPEYFRFLWAISSGKRKPSDIESRRAKAAALKAKLNKDQEVDIPGAETPDGNGDIPF